MSAWIEIEESRLFDRRKVIVALLVSAWIEINIVAHEMTEHWVALLVSAWIEITSTNWQPNDWNSRTPRECVD